MLACSKQIKPTEEQVQIQEKMLNTKLFIAHNEDLQADGEHEPMNLSIKEVLSRDPAEFENKIFIIPDPNEAQPVDKLSRRFYRLKVE